MLTFAKHPSLLLAALATSVFGCIDAGGDDPPAVDPSGAAAGTTAGATDVVESPLVAAPRKCERMALALARIPSRIAAMTMPLPGPYQAAITRNGTQISCTSPVGSDFATIFRWTESFQTPPVPHLFQYSSDGGSVMIQPSLPAQQTAAQVYPRPIGVLTCAAAMVNVTTPGFPDQRVNTFAKIRVLPTGPDFTVECEVHVRGPVLSVRDRPPEVIATSADRFIYACDVAPDQRRTACSAGLCTVQCTSNLTPPIDPAGVNRCISDCATRCAAVSCPPIFCDGASCPPGTCSAANACTTSSQCGSNRECAANCCVTIIR